MNGQTKVCIVQAAGREVGSAAMQLQYWTDNCIVQGCIYICFISAYIVIVGVSHIEYRDIYIYILTLSIYDLTASYSAAN